MFVHAEIEINVSNVSNEVDDEQEKTVAEN